jgi:nucleoid-associated protein YgaU
MVSPQRSVSAVVPAAERPVAVRPAPARPVPARARPATAGRASQPVAPVTARRDAVRPGARPARLDGVAGPRPVRGGCSSEGVARPVAGGRPLRSAVSAPPPLRLTRRGRRVVAGLSIAVGLAIAVVTVSVELRDGGGGLQLAGSSTVVVRSGDTLWSLAQELAPREDPRVVVDAIVDLNGLDGVGLVPGQVLQLP